MTLSPNRVLEAAQKMDQVCRELAWWTKPMCSPDDLAEKAREAIREFRRAHSEYDGSLPLEPLDGDVE